MKKPGAFAILGTMIMIPLLAWGGTKIVSLSEKVAVNSTKIQSTKEILDKMDKKLDRLIERGN